MNPNRNRNVDIKFGNWTLIFITIIALQAND